MNCLITGASIGIGHDVVLKLASLNYNIYFTYLSNFNKAKELQEEVINKYNVKCYIKKCDLSCEEDILNTIDDFKDKLGNLDVLINNASYSSDNLIIDKTKEEFMKVIDVNLVGTFLISKYSFDIMNEHGIIINMSSTDGIDTMSLYNVDYAASKAGIISLTKSFSLSFNNIRTVALAPNWVNTESTREMNQEYLKSELRRIGQDKLINIDTIVNKIIHIIVDKNIKSGSIIRIDGDSDE